MNAALGSLQAARLPGAIRFRFGAESGCPGAELAGDLPLG